MFKLPSFPILDFCNIITLIKDKYSINEASALNQVKRSKTPTLFIHGDKDNFVPFNMVNELYDACPSDKDKLVIEGVGHAKCENI
jgi:fermentation-respiration switch protein FrsA (DUF1100 family)